MNHQQQIKLKYLPVALKGQIHSRNYNNNQKKHHTQNLTSYIFDGYNYNRCMYIWAYFCCCCCCSMWCVLFGSTVENHRCFFVHLSFILLCYGSLCVTVFMYEYVWRVALFLANRVGFLCALRRSVTFIYCFN